MEHSPSKGRPFASRRGSRRRSTQGAHIHSILFELRSFKKFKPCGQHASAVERPFCYHRQRLGTGALHSPSPPDPLAVLPLAKPGRSPALPLNFRLSFRHVVIVLYGGLAQSTADSKLANCGILWLRYMHSPLLLFLLLYSESKNQASTVRSS